MEYCLFLNRGMEHCLFLMNLEVWNIVYEPLEHEPRRGTLFISNEPRGMEHCLFLLNLEA